MNTDITIKSAEETPAGTVVGTEIVKPKNDELEYRLMQLDNGLRAVLVSDPTTDKAAASMEVRWACHVSASLRDLCLADPTCQSKTRGVDISAGIHL